MYNIRNTFVGFYYIIIGAIFAFIVWSFGEELIRILITILGIILIIIGGLSIILYYNIKKVGSINSNAFLYDGIFKIIFGFFIVFVSPGIISSILGIIFLIYTIIISILEKNIMDLFGKSLYKLIIAFMIIFCGIENIGIWVLRIMDGLIILYGFILLIIASINKPKGSVEFKNDNLIDVEFEESKDE